MLGKLPRCVAKVRHESYLGTLAKAPLKGGLLPRKDGSPTLPWQVAKQNCQGASGTCIHHWLVDPPEAVCRCDGTEHLHSYCKRCKARRTFPAFLETGPIAKAAMYAKRGARATWKGRRPKVSRRSESAEPVNSELAPAL